MNRRGFLGAGLLTALTPSLLWATPEIVKAPKESARLQLVKAKIRLFEVEEEVLRKFQIVLFGQDQHILFREYVRNFERDCEHLTAIFSLNHTVERTGIYRGVILFDDKGRELGREYFCRSVPCVVGDTLNVSYKISID